MLRAAQTSKIPRRGARLWSGLVGVAALLVSFFVLTLLVAGPLEPVDQALNRPRDISGIRPMLETVDRIGQRMVCLPILGLVAARVAYRVRSWRPLIVAAVSVFAVNLFVAVFKFSLERGEPLEAEPDFLAGGVMYPSGHAANVVLVYGVAAYLWWRYADASRQTRWVLSGVVVVLSLVMVTTSLTLRWHWFTDLLGGVLAGAAVLRATITLDRFVPFTARRRPGVGGRSPTDGPQDTRPKVGSP